MKKRLLTLLLCICILGFTIYKLDSIVNIAKKFFNNTPTLSIEKKNQFSKNKDYDFVQISKDYKP